MQSDNKTTRREFLVNMALGAGAAAFAGSILYPLIKYITPPKGLEATVSSVVAAKVGELAANAGKVFRFGDKPAILVNTPQGEYRAFNAVCTHLNCTVQYDAESSHIWCACHNGRFDLTGKVISGPPPRPLTEYKVIVQGEDVIVSKT